MHGVDLNCEGWLHIDPRTCRAAPYASARTANLAARLAAPPGFSLRDAPWRCAILIRHLPLDWFDLLRTDGAASSTSLLRDEDIINRRSPGEGASGGSIAYARRDGGFGRVYVVGRTMYETDRIPLRWVGALNKLDEVRRAWLSLLPLSLPSSL